MDIDNSVLRTRKRGGEGLPGGGQRGEKNIGASVIMSMIFLKKILKIFSNIFNNFKLPFLLISTKIYNNKREICSLDRMSFWASFLIKPG